MTELRVTDLRFTPSEAVACLNQAMGLNLSAEDVTALETRTEGWIAGLQLAALSMQGHQDVSGFIRAFAGDHRYIVDYLVEEVLQRQPESVRSFLLQTSILDRLNGPLCDAVTDQEGGTARLEALERGNFFVVPLDDRRLPDICTVAHGAAAWKWDRNACHSTVHWRFTTSYARIKLKHLYPVIYD